MRRGIILIALVLLGSHVTVKSAGKVSNNVPASVTYSNRAGDRIYSDGMGAYLGQITVSFEYFWVDLQSSTRFLNFDYAGRLTGNGTTGLLAGNDVWFKITGITQLPCDGNAYERKYLIDNSWGKTRFEEVDGATNVLVTRLDRWTWRALGDVIPDINGNPLRYDVARLVQVSKGKWVTVGLYSMPFELTIAADRNAGNAYLIPLTAGCAQ